jgi:hypothetical protein
MKDYTGKENIIYVSTEELGLIGQNCNQFDNYSITIWKILEDEGDLKAGMVFGREDILSDCNDYVLEESDVIILSIVGISKYLENWASDWANNGEEDQVVEMCRWGLNDPEDFAYEGADFCNVLVKEYYYGYTPIYRAHDNQGEPLEFANSLAAQKWIDEQQGKMYYLSHNEAGRPTYVVVPAL